MRSAILFLIAFMSCTVLAQETDWQQFVSENPFAEYASTQPQTETETVSATQTSRPVGYKSPKKALALSALIPGAGQAYAGSYYKTAGFVAVEALSWTMFMIYNKEGKNIEREFQQFADTHWIENDYWDWIARHSGIDRNNMDALREWEEERFSHHLHLVKDQQYYEMIGKYDQFNYGWDDSDIGLLDEDWDISKRSARRLYYEDRRDASNRAFKKATTGVTIAMLNHILSAIDAAWTVSRHNKQLAQVSLRFRPIRYDREALTALTLNVTW